MSYTKQQVDENTDYKAGHAISLEDRMISVKYDSTLCLKSEGRFAIHGSDLPSDDKIKPGVMSSSSLDLKEMLLRGELMNDIIYDKTENVIRYKELIADNGFTLHKSPLIFIYKPKDFCEEIINGIKY